MAQRIFDSQYGEVKLVEKFDCNTNEEFLEVYIGDNYDEYVGEVFVDIEASDAEIDRALEEIL